MVKFGHERLGNGPNRALWEAKFVETVFVTGAANGIGLASAHAFAKAGSRVALGDIDASAVAEAAAAIPGSISVVMDVTDRASVEAAFDEVEAAAGPIDVLHANAGVSTMRPAIDLTDED
jgi:NAD(P)-dependent dehydrogenase (short-subunit alcohol dehydrogenase family)